MVSFGIFANALRGAFVYDDERQIVANALVTTPGLEWRALTSDVWAFKTASADPSQRTAAVSNYWRPAFTALLIVEHRLFGLSSTKPWHAVNIAMHAAICVLAFALLRRLNLGTPAAFGCSLIFAVHPVHVETVTWISGSPDLLISIAVLVSMLGATMLAQGPGFRASRLLSLIAWLAVILGYILAVASKEIGILAWAPVAACVFTAPAPINDSSRKGLPRTSLAAIVAAPGVLIAVVYWMLRSRILGGNEAGGGSPTQLAPDAASWLSVALSAPSIALFYLRQMVWPWEGFGALHATARFASAVQPSPAFEFPGGVAAAHPLRAITRGSIGLFNFWLPAFVCALAGVLSLLAAYRSRTALLGLVLLAAMLAPAFNIRVFPTEHIVRDRYLYLPLLGVLMLVAGFVQYWLAVRNRRNTASDSPLTTGHTNRQTTAARAVSALPWVTAALVGVIAVAMSIKTVRYNPAWTSNMRLWQNAVRADPTSSMAHAQLAAYLSRSGQLDEALVAYQRAYELAPMIMVLIDRAVVELKLGNRELASGRGRADAAGRWFSLAEEDSRAGLNSLIRAGGPPDAAMANAYQGLGMALNLQGKHAQAAAVYREAADRIAFERAHFSGRLAVVLYQQNDKAGALRVLEGAKDAAKTELNAPSKLVLHRLATLYGEMQRGEDALDMYRQFLAASEAWQADEEVQQIRSQVIALFKANNLPLR